MAADHALLATFNKLGLNQLMRSLVRERPSVTPRGGGRVEISAAIAAATACQASVCGDEFSKNYVEVG
jgi:hypothetical protein